MALIHSDLVDLYVYDWIEDLFKKVQFVYSRGFGPEFLINIQLDLFIHQTTGCPGKNAPLL